MKQIGRKSLSVLLVLIMVIGLLPAVSTTAKAWEALNITLSNITQNADGKVTGFDLSYTLTEEGSGGQAESMIGVQTVPFATGLTRDEAKTIPWDDSNEALEKLQSNALYGDYLSLAKWYGDLTNLGRVCLACQFKSIDDVKSYQNFCAYYGLSGFSQNTFHSFGDYLDISENIDFTANPIDMSKDATYYIYMWTLYNNKLYPDALLGTMEIKDGNISLMDKDGNPGTVVAPHTHDEIDFIEWTDEEAQKQYKDFPYLVENPTATNCLPRDAGSYYLAENVTLSDSWDIYEKIDLCLKGKTITADGNFPAATVYEGTLNLYDCEGTGTITHADGTSDCGVQVYNEDAVFNMYGGTITGNEGGVDVSYGTFTLYGGKICGNIAEEGGGVNVNYDGRFYMEGGEISGNTASRNGGGIRISGVTVITGGKISDNSAEAGGGLYVMCPLEETVFSNAEFSGNKAEWGAGLYVDLDGAEVELKNLTIKDNVASGDGGGLYFGYGDLTLTNCTVTGNEAIKGAGIFNYMASLMMEDGEISGNTASETGGGVYLYGEARSWGISPAYLIPSGAPKIIDNEEDGGGIVSNLYVPADSYSGVVGMITAKYEYGEDKYDTAKTCDAVSLSSGAQIGVRMEDPGQFSYVLPSSNADGIRQYFSSDDTNYVVKLTQDKQLILGVDEGVVTFYADAEGTKVLSAKTYPSGTALSEITKPADQTRNGYYFAGWTTEKKEDPNEEYSYKQAVPDSGKSEDDLAKYPCILTDFSDGAVTGDMAFYPVFIKDRLNVKLDPGDGAKMGTGSDGKEQDTDFNVNIDEPIRMTGLLSTTREGYEQDGWYTAKGVKWNPKGTTDESTWWPMTPEYADSSTPVKHESLPYNYYTVTLTAHWKAKTADVTYALGDHAAAGATAPADGSVALGDTFTLPKAPGAAEGYRFTGWKLGDTLYSAGAVVSFDDWSLTEDGKLTVTAQYIESNDQSIFFETNGGTAIEPIVAKPGAEITAPAVPTRTGYEFAGWFSDPELKTKAELPGTMPEKGTTYYAGWSTIKSTIKYTISFKLNGATNPSSMDPYTVEYDTAIPEFRDPEREHYTFVQWSPELPGKMPAKNLTVEAIWEPLPYSVTFKANADDSGTEIKGLYGSLVTPPDDPTAEGLLFAEWSVSKPIYMVEENEIITAKWKPDPKVSNETVSGKKDGKITGVTDEMEYSADGGTTWNPVPNGATEVTDLASGTYLVRFSKKDNYKSDAVTTVTIQPGKNEGDDTGPYPVNVTEPDNGSVKADKDNAVNGDRVTLTITPDNGYETDKVTVTDDDGKEIPVTKNADGKYSFNMPAGKVTVSVTFKKSSKPTPPTPVIPDGDYVTEPSYPVSVTSPDNGSVKADKSSADKGEKVTLTITPDEGYEIANVKITDSDGKEIPFTVNADGTYTFVMPASRVTVSVEFRAVKGAPSPVSPADSGIADWLITDEHNLYIAGYPEGDVRPKGNITRAETAMLFYRLLKDKNVEITVSFPDVKEGEWYAEAVNVLSSLNVFYGRTDGNFDPNERITRAEFATAATRFAKAIQGKAVFSDVPEGYWAYDSIASAAAYGWIVGYEDDTFRPEGYITRAEVTAIVNRMLGRAADEAYISANRDNLVQFSDLQDPDAWYYLDMMEAANTHDFTVTDGSETWK